MDNKWIEKDEKLNKTYTELKEKNPQFSEKFPDYNKFCEAVSPSYKATIESEAAKKDDKSKDEPAK